MATEYFYNTPLLDTLLLIINNLLDNENIEINFDKVPIIILNNRPFSINIEFKLERYIFTQYFQNYEDSKYGYFLYCLIVNLGILNYQLYGGIIRDMFNNDIVNDLDFSINNYITYVSISSFLHHTYNCSYTNLEQSKQYFLRKNNIFIIIHILYRIIYNDNIIYNYMSLNKTNLKLNFNVISIDINYNRDLKNSNYDFYENMLCIEYNTTFTLKSIKLYNYNKNLVKFLLLSFIPANIATKFINIINIICNMLGEHYLCTYESIYHIVKRKMRLTHDNCYTGCSVKNENIFNKISNYRIPKMKQKKFIILYDNKCKKYNCICYITTLLNIYEKYKYQVKFKTFVENYYHYNSIFSSPFLNTTFYINLYSKQHSNAIIYDNLYDSYYDKHKLKYDDKHKYDDKLKYDKIKYEENKQKKIKYNTLSKEKREQKLIKPEKSKYNDKLYFDKRKKKINNFRNYDRITKYS